MFAFARFTAEELYITVCSADTVSRTVDFPLSIFGSSFAHSPAPEKDALGEKLCARIKAGVLSVEIPAGKSYLIKV